MISFVIPAHNEEIWVGRCVAAIQSAAGANGEEYEVIVVDDSSGDATSAVALRHGARVIHVEPRHISAARNAGAHEAQGDVLFFVDADSLVGARLVNSAMAQIRAGAVGGGCVPKFDGALPLWWKVTYPILALGMRAFCLPGGCCLFCTRSAFEAIGGFSEAHYAAEDALFATALKRCGLFIVPGERVLTSGRNLRAHSFWTISRLLLRLALFGPDGFRDRRGLDVWYNPLRERRNL